MLRNEIQKFLPSYRLNQILVGLRNKSVSVDIEKLENESNTDVIDEEAKARDEEIDRKRNKSRLKECDRNFLFEKNPYPTPQRWHHGTLKYLRRLYGRYGEASGVNPSICWPVKEELEEAKEYERVAHPFTIPQMVDEAKKKRDDKNERTRVRQEQIVAKLGKLEDMKRELYNRIKKKENEAMAAKERKERLIEEVRMHFGYTVDPRDDKFKELLEKKEKEQKKGMKEARKKEREANMMATLLAKKTSKTQNEDTNKQ